MRTTALLLLAVVVTGAPSMPSSAPVGAAPNRS